MFGSGPAEEASKAAKSIKPVHWDDVIGCADAKAALQEAIESPHLDKEIYEFFKIPSPKGVLLYGPPGNGKTLLGKAAATALAKMHGSDGSDGGFFYFNGGKMLGPGYSSESDFMKAGFKAARDFYENFRRPAVLFYDECDAMLPKRETADMFFRNAVNIFLSEMDGIGNSPVFVILATNDLGRLDEAAIRAGRIDRKIYVGRPNKEDATAMLRLYLKDKPLLGTLTLDRAVEIGAKALFDEGKVVGSKHLSARLNGAMIKNLADGSASIAFRRAIAIRKRDGRVDRKTLGISEEDVLGAVTACYQEALTMKKHHKTPIHERMRNLAIRQMEEAVGVSDGYDEEDPKGVTAL